MQSNLKWTERIELMALLFLHGMALAAWFVPMGTVLEEAQLKGLTPFAFASSAVAALLSPLFFGAMADRSVPPLVVLRWISIGSAILAAAVAWAITAHWPAWLILVGIQLQSLLSVPSTSLTGSIVFSRLSNSQRQFGSIRALGTLGWMTGCWLVSLMHIDASPRSFQISAMLWIVLSAYTFLIPKGTVAASIGGRLTLRERFGLDALSLLRNAEHRVIFVTAALIAIPFAAFYPYTPAHMTDLGLQRTSALMSLGQVSEVGVMFAIGAILSQWRLKWVILTGLTCGVLRYFLYAVDSQTSLLAGVCLHGLAYTFTYISAQIYLAKRIDASWRTRAQALLSMVTGGIGNLIGYLCTGGWLYLCTNGEQENWRVFWSGLCILVFGVLVYFAVSYRGREKLE